MADILKRWASLGIAVEGKIDPFEDPEVLITESLPQVAAEGRLFGFIATWISRYGHLLLTKKLRFHSNRDRRVFRALIEESGTDDPKLQRIAHVPYRGKTEFLFENLTPEEKRWARAEPNPRFLRHGFLIRRYDIVRPEILHETETVFRRSVLLRNRALYGASFRSDLLAVLPKLGKVTLRGAARKLHISHAGLLHVIRELERSGLVRRLQAGRNSTLEWSAVLTV